MAVEAPADGPLGGPADGPAVGTVEPLACGRDAADVWDRAEAGAPPDAHELGCPYCTAVYAEAGSLDAIVYRMAAEPVEPPASVLRAVMGAVDTELRAQETLRLASPLEPNQLAHSAAATVLRAVVDTVDGLRARSCRIEQPEPGFAVDIALTLTARFGVDLAGATAEVRRSVLAASEQVLGLPARRVDIEVVDLWLVP